LTAAKYEFYSTEITDKLYTINATGMLHLG